jgi:hypothetical protein
MRPIFLFVLTQQYETESWSGNVIIFFGGIKGSTEKKKKKVSTFVEMIVLQ